MIERVLVGTLGRPHGLRGDLSVWIRTDAPELRFAPGSALVAEPGGRRLSVRDSRWNSGVLLLSFEKVADRSAAESLRGLDLWAEVALDDEPDEDDVFHDRRLIGLAVRDAGGVPVGQVTAVLHHPGQDLLVVDVGGEQRLVPFVAALVPVVDVAAGYLQVADLPGLLTEVDEA